MAAPNPIFRMFNPGKKSKEAAAEQRREQLRRAQNTYRQRKTRYVKDLEVALTKSQQREHNLATELQHLQRACQDHGISTLSPSLSPRQQPGAHATSLRGIPPTARACDVDAATLGMTFVLKIEEPCLDHIHGSPDKPDDPNGHAMTATQHLFALKQQNHNSHPEKQYTSPSPPTQRFTSRFTKSSPASSAGYTSPAASGSTPDSSTSSWPSPLLEAAAGDTPPALILERLLALAPEVVVTEARGDDSSSEISAGVTPIQAWDQIRRRPVTGSLDLRSIMGLAEKLRDAAKCHGFGAVVDYNVFQRLVAEFMSANISFTTPGRSF